VCSSGVEFNPVVEGVHYTFDVAGLYNGVFVMRDRQTGSIWTHYDGAVLQGPLAGTDLNLTFLPLIHTTWAEWLRNYPDSFVLDWYPEFAARYRDFMRPGQAGLGPNFVRTVLNWDDRLAENEMVLGVALGSETRAYVLDDFPLELSVIADRLGNHPVVGFIDPRAGFGLAYSPIVDGEVLKFRVEDESVTDSSGTTWDLRGRAVAGPLKDSQLVFVTSFVTEWYGWAAYHPETTIFGR
jgi:hypothetical protein